MIISFSSSVVEYEKNMLHARLLKLYKETKNIKYKKAALRSMAPYGPNGPYGPNWVRTSDFSVNSRTL